MIRIEPSHPNEFSMTILIPLVGKLIGLVILGLGVYLLGYGLGVPGIKVMDEGGSPAKPVQTLIFGAGMAVLGYGFIFGRKGVIVDRARGEVVRWTGAPMPLWKRRYPLSWYQRVTIGRERHEDADRSYEKHPVRLEGEDGRRLLIFSPSDHREAWLAMQEISAFMGWPTLTPFRPEEGTTGGWTPGPGTGN
ncbi:MAG TPA: hypothetical protein VM658_12990 [bacterium]|nr:hypothetical protein [bacterium]